MSVSLPSIASFHQGAHSVAVVGLGYVGLPLAVAFARHFNVIGFDLNAARVEELSAGTDRTGEVDSEALQASTARFTRKGLPGLWGGICPVARSSCTSPRSIRA